MTDLFRDVCPCCGQPVQPAQATPFDLFWRRWPDKRAKIPAEKAWVKLSLSEQQVAFDRCEAWCKAWRKRNPETSHIMAATYLNQRRFLDEPEMPGPTKEGMEAAMKQQAASIRSGKAFRCTHISASRARDLIGRGMVTEDECRKVGVL